VLKSAKVREPLEVAGPVISRERSNMQLNLKNRTAGVKVWNGQIF